VVQLDHVTNDPAQIPEMRKDDPRKKLRAER
jgi:hypothetical protein